MIAQSELVFPVLYRNQPPAEAGDGQKKAMANSPSLWFIGRETANCPLTGSPPPEGFWLGRPQRTGPIFWEWVFLGGEETPL
jgi:hypothetical protein